MADGLSIGTEIGDLEWLYMTLNGVWPPTRAIYTVTDELFVRFRYKVDNLFHGLPDIISSYNLYLGLLILSGTRSTILMKLRIHTLLNYSHVHFLFPSYFQLRFEEKITRDHRSERTYYV